MNNRGVLFLAVLLASIQCAMAAPLVSQDEFINYDELMDSLFASGKTTTVVDGALWVPWFKTSSSCESSDLQDGNACGGIDATFNTNCMVSDEFSQVGILVAMGKDAARMEQFYNMIGKIQSKSGSLPAWRIFRDGNSIEPCKQGINGNCDTASDATARFIIALFTASKSSYFSDEQKAKYENLARQMSQDFITYEVDSTCRPSSLGQGNICHWLAGGSNVKKAGIGSSDFAYTGYYPDAIIAMLQAYSSTGNELFAAVARNITLNYLEASNWDGKSFSVPPGKSFKWVPDSSGIPNAVCTNNCNPVEWDGYDASRALGMCQALYYSDKMGLALPGLKDYCSVWSSKYMSNPKSAPLQYRPNGESLSYQSGYFAQGLQSLFHSGANSVLFPQSLGSALGHYSKSTRTFDYTPCFGVYTQAFVMRSLGMGIGRDEASFATKEPSKPEIYLAPLPPAPAPLPPPIVEPAKAEIASEIANLSKSCTPGCVARSDSIKGDCRAMVFTTANGDIKLLGCKKDNGYAELFTQLAPAGFKYTACLGSGCVSESNGFARFKISQAEVISPPAPVKVVPKGVASLVVSATNYAVKVYDAIEKTGCRNVRFNTAKAYANVRICPKELGRYEMYLLSSPSVISVCVNSKCVGSNSGFASFKP